MPVELIGLNSVPIVQARAPLIGAGRSWALCPWQSRQPRARNLSDVVRSRRNLNLHPQRIRFLASRTLTGIEPDQERQSEPERCQSTQCGRLRRISRDREMSRAREILEFRLHGPVNLPILAIVVGRHGGLFIGNTTALGGPDVLERGVEPIVRRVSPFSPAGQSVRHLPHPSGRLARARIAVTAARRSRHWHRRFPGRFPAPPRDDWLSPAPGVFELRFRSGFRDCDPSPERSSWGAASDCGCSRAKLRLIAASLRTRVQAPPLARSRPGTHRRSGLPRECLPRQVPCCRGRNRSWSANKRRPARAPRDSAGGPRHMPELIQRCPRIITRHGRSRRDVRSPC